jgi:hypothetical protein
MQQHIYTTTKRKIFRQSFFIWLYVLSQLVMNIWVVFFYENDHKFFLFVFFNLLISAIITVPGIIIFFNYYRYSVNKEFIVSYNNLKLRDVKSNKIIEINNDEIERIELHEIVRGTSLRSPYYSYEYFCFIDKNNKRIVVTFHILSLGDFWFDTLTQKVSSKKLVKVERYFPMIKK